MEDLNFDFGYFKEFLKRNLNLLLKFFGLGITLTLISLLIQEKRWEGDFEIVIRENKEKLSAQDVIANTDSFSLPNLAKSTLNTELAILKSPLILYPIYEESKKKDNFELSFSNWKKKHLRIELERGTTVLKVRYSDSDKNYIKKVLKDISNAYQFYSNRDRENKLNLTSKYLTEQIKIYEEKYLYSLQELQKLALKYDLPISTSTSIQKISLEDLTKFEKTNLDKLSPESSISSNLDITRTEQSNRIRFLEKAIIEFDNNINNNEWIISFAAKFPSVSNSDIFKSINDLNLKLTKSRLVFVENDKRIKSYKREISILTNKLKKIIRANLESSKSIALAKINSSKRPQDVLIKYNNLKRITNSNFNTISNLKSREIQTNLKKAEYIVPWELITKPTVENNPYYPEIIPYLFFGFSISSILAFFLAYIKERQNDLIFSEKYLKEVLNTNIINLSKVFPEKDLSASLDIFLNSYEFDKTDNVTFIKLGNLDSEKINIIKKITNKNSINFLNINDLIGLKEKKEILFIASIGKVKQTDIISINNKLLIFKGYINGCILV